MNILDWIKIGIFVAISVVVVIAANAVYKLVLAAAEKIKAPTLDNINPLSPDNYLYQMVSWPTATGSVGSSIFGAVNGDSWESIVEYARRNQQQEIEESADNEDYWAGMFAQGADMETQYVPAAFGIYPNTVRKNDDTHKRIPDPEWTR